MNSENIKKVTNQAIGQLITALNEGRSEMLKQYLEAIGRFHHYSLRNVMLISSQKPTASHVAAFHVTFLPLFWSPAVVWRPSRV
jgi:hypothetical protein